MHRYWQLPKHNTFLQIPRSKIVKNHLAFILECINFITAVKNGLIFCPSLSWSFFFVYVCIYHCTVYSLCKSHWRHNFCGAGAKLLGRLRSNFSTEKPWLLKQYEDSGAVLPWVWGRWTTPSGTRTPTGRECPKGSLSRQCRLLRG